MKLNLIRNNKNETQLIVNNKNRIATKMNLQLIEITKMK